uniref:Uncharacterized protein n=1 Tax=Amphilophus citrinellus TaxID=61819 RepID=A0A3Q0T113_AMPCI
KTIITLLQSKSRTRCRLHHKIQVNSPVKVFDATLKRKTTLKDSEPAAQPASKEQGSPEKEDEPPQTSETSDPLNTYKWHTAETFGAITLCKVTMVVM